MSTIFSDSWLEWLLATCGAAPADATHVTPLGFGPFGEDEYDEMLVERGVTPCAPDPETDVLVLGTTGWTSLQLEEVLRDRAGLTLRVYSQEMFLLYLVSGEDPLRGLEEDVRALADDHPGLMYLERAGFAWPTTIVGVGNGLGIAKPSLRQGFLGSIGYRTGESGRTMAARQSLLAQAYTSSLPASFPDWYVREWGPPSTHLRLSKMAESIAAFCRNAMRRRSPPHAAISDWVEDLAWLKRTFYDGHYVFTWPSIEVW